MEVIGLLKRLPDKACIELLYRRAFGTMPDLENPKTFNEKLQWLKLYDRRPEYTTMVDKFEAKKWVADRIGEQYIIPTLGVWDTFQEIDFDALPDQFVLKCTHDSGGIVICKDKNNFDIEKAGRILDKALKVNYSRFAREWMYEDVKPRIIAEKYMEDGTSGDLKDYKFFCFNGKVKCFKIDFDRYIDHHANYFDENNQLLPFGEVYCPPDYECKLKMPTQLEWMKELAETLSQGLRFIRVDFYEVDGRVYFGELTFFPNAGLGKFTKPEADELLGSWLTL